MASDPLTDWRAVDRKLTTTGAVETLLDCEQFTVAKVSFVIEDADALLYFGWAPSLPPGLRLRRGEGYSEEGLQVTNAIRFTNAVPGGLPRVRGIVWGRAR